MLVLAGSEASSLMAPPRLLDRIDTPPMLEDLPELAAPRLVARPGPTVALWSVAPPEVRQLAHDAAVGRELTWPKKLEPISEATLFFAYRNTPADSE